MKGHPRPSSSLRRMRLLLACVIVVAVCAVAFVVVRNTQIAAAAEGALGQQLVQLPRRSNATVVRREFKQEAATGCASHIVPLAPRLCTAREFGNHYTAFRAVQDVSGHMWSACTRSDWLPNMLAIAPEVERQREASQSCRKKAAARAAARRQGSPPSDTAAAAEPGVEPFVFINIGANKGMAFAAWIAALAPKLGLSPPRLQELLGMYAPEVTSNCGVCGDCRFPSDDARVAAVWSPILDAGRVVVHAFEPAPTTYGALAKVAKVAKVPFLHLHHAAMSNVVGKTKFAACEAGAEGCAIVSEDESKNLDPDTFVDVDVTTVDAFVEKEGIGHILVLKIDAEGYDPLVLEGARGVLSQGRVSILQFEYHAERVWGQRHLEVVVAQLAVWGYDCYYDGQGTLTRLTGCWFPYYEIHFWSNIMCAQRGSLAYAAIAEAHAAWSSPPHASEALDDQLAERTPDREAMQRVAVAVKSAQEALAERADVESSGPTAGGAAAASAITAHLKKKKAKATMRGGGAATAGAAAGAGADEAAGGSTISPTKALKLYRKHLGYVSTMSEAEITTMVRAPAVGVIEMWAPIADLANMGKEPMLKRYEKPEPQRRQQGGDGGQQQQQQQANGWSPDDAAEQAAADLDELRLQQAESQDPSRRGNGEEVIQVVDADDDFNGNGA